MNKRLYRNRQEGALSGVCAGLAEYLNVDKTWIRLAFVVSVIFSSMLGLGMIGPIVYIVLWIAVPARTHAIAEPGSPYGAGSAHKAGSPYEAGSAFDSQDYYGAGAHYDVDYRVGASSGKRKKEGKSSQDRYIAGLILLIIGVFFLLHQLNILFVHDIIRYWPVLLILSGIMVLFGAFKGQGEPAIAEPAYHEVNIADEAVSEEEAASASDPIENVKNDEDE